MRTFRKERPPGDPTKLADFTRADMLLKEVRGACKVPCAPRPHAHPHCDHLHTCPTSTPGEKAGGCPMYHFPRPGVSLAPAPKPPRCS